MSRKLAVVLTVVLAVSAVRGQNARLNAMSGFNLFGDVSDILFNPAYMSDYKNVLQGTYDGPTLTTEGGLGPVIGVKSLGDVLSVGFTYNPNPLYTTQAVPHPIIGVGMDKWSLALELAYERDWQNTEEEDTDILNPTVTGVTTTENIASYLTATLGFGLSIDPVALAVAFYAGLPYDKDCTYTETRSAGNPTTSTEATVKNSGVIDLGGYVEGAFGVGDFDVTAGFTADLSLYGKSEVTVHNVPAPPTPNFDTTYEIGSDNVYSMLTLYGGAVKTFEQAGIKVGAMADIGWMRDKETVLNVDTLNYATTEQWMNSLGLFARLAIEKEWTSLKRLDAIAARTGMAYGIYDIIDHTEGAFNGGNYVYREKFAAVRYQDGFQWDLGMGVKKGILAFDVDISPTAIIDFLKYSTGNYTAQDLASLTLTLDFKEIGKSRKAKSAPAAEPASAPESEPMDSGLSF